MLKQKSSWISFKSILFILIILLIGLYLLLNKFSSDQDNKILENSLVMEHFEDKMLNMVESDLFDKEFVDFYEIIYRDYYDIDKDHKVFMGKTINPMVNKKEANICVLGSGVGKVCNKLKEEGLQVVGVDKSEQMLKKSQLLYTSSKEVFL